MSTTVNIHEAKTHLSDLLKKAMNGEEVIIAKANKPLVRLVPVAASPKERVFGLNRGMIQMGPDFDAPLTELFEPHPDDPLENWMREKKLQAAKAAKKTRGAKKK